MQSILALGNSHDRWDADFGYAAKFAALTESSLTGTLVCPTPSASGALYGATEAFALILESIRSAERKAYEARGEFEKWARDQGVRHAAWQVAEGSVPDVLRHLGNWHDLLVLTRRDWGDAEAAQIGAVAIRSGLPALVVPPDFDDAPSLRSVAVAWNGSAEAVRAIHAARPLLERAGRVTVLSGEIRDPFSEIGWLPNFNLESYFARHAIPVSFVAIGASGADAGRAILDAAAANEATLLVMGAYGRSRFSEWAFGGATRHALAHAPMPLLLRH
ncbi:universal stress protein [Tahibacter soli]|uniref:Universal stress protein n=1 Tax=Tahibacter soli TaxID=2983605 RepID=A0A9X4BFS8_9GAMM|nr:universal stress protein [Tahibacter soli]MDC8011685.1 universal stress protein [Tahibacter soli]